MKARFVFVSSMSGSPWGGSEELWSQAASRLSGEGHRVSASVPYWREMSPKVLKLREAGVEIYVRTPLKNNLAQRAWRKVKRKFCEEIPREDSWLLRQSPDLVIISQGGNRDGGRWMTLCLEAGLPYVSIIQCNAEHFWPDDEDGKRLARGYAGAKKVFCVSRGNLRLLERQLAQTFSNAEVVWNPCNSSPDAAITWPEEDGVWKMACVARLEPSAKGQDLLFEAMAGGQWRGRAVEINLYGGGSHAGNLQRLAEQFGLKNVRFCGHVSNVSEIWARNHILALPSRYEGLPLALVEAMWCARPAVVTDIGGNAEACVDGESGFVAAAPTAGLFNEALERAWERRHEWRQMGLAARARAEKVIPRDPVKEFCGKLVGCVQ